MYLKKMLFVVLIDTDVEANKLYIPRHIHVSEYRNVENRDKNPADFFSYLRTPADIFSTMSFRISEKSC